jgi:hypothetical protein
MLFILVGTLILLVNVDVLNNNFWIDFVYLFPFLLIAIGIEKIFAHTRLKGLSYFTTVLLVAGAFYVAFEGSRDSGGSSFFQSTTLVYDEDEPVDVIDADLDLGKASLTIRDAADELMKARFGEWSYKPRSSLNVENRRAGITLSNRAVTRRLWGRAIEIDGDKPDDWRVSFSREVPLNLTISGDECELHLNMATTPLRSLRMEVVDADAYLKVGELEPAVTVRISGRDSRLRLRVPQESGLRVSGVDDPAYLEEIGLVEQAGSYVTEGFEDAETRIQVEIDDRFRSLSIDFY